MDHFQFFTSLNTEDPVPVGYVNASTKQLAWNYNTASAILHDTTNATWALDGWDVVTVEYTELNV